MARNSQGTSATAPTIRYLHQYLPYPLAGVISPWNFPMLLAMTDAIPALLAGCAVLAKPSEVTPRFVEPLQSALNEVTELAEVCGLVTGNGATGQALIDQVDAICFTGSVATGRKVAAQAGQRLIPAFLELGGKDPLVVLEGANPASAATAALRSAAIGTGQACQSIERIYVHQSLAEPFIAELVREASAVRTNEQSIDQGDLGPFIDRRQADLVESQLDEAVGAGARILCGGLRRHESGAAWCLPTVVTGVDHGMRLMQEETFGPILPVMTFATDDEAVRLANDSRYGLSAAVIGGSLDQALAVARRIQAGAVSVGDASLTTLVSDVEKHSFGDSGLGGSRMGPSGLLRFLRTKALLIQEGTVQPLAAFSEGGTPPS